MTTESTSTDRPTLLELDSVDVHYGPIQALRTVSLKIREGEIVALLGANGAGKSSTLRVISGMISPSSGSVSFRGRPIGGLPSHSVVKYEIAHVPEGRELFPSLSVEENLRLGYWPRRRSGGSLSAALERVYEILPKMRERRLQAAGTLSGGEQQMLVMGRALVSSPKLLLIDEMSLGLAPLVVRALFEVVDRINAEGTSVILVEQFVHQALQHSTRAYVLAKGEVTLEANSADLRNDPNLVAAYLGGAEGHIEDVSVSSVGSPNPKEAE